MNGLDAAQIIDNLLATHMKSASKRQELADEIADTLRTEGHIYDDGWVTGVEIHGARVPIESLAVYGLNIEVDANGNAVTVSSPHGFAVTA